MAPAGRCFWMLVVPIMLAIGAPGVLLLYFSETPYMKGNLPITTPKDGWRYSAESIPDLSGMVAIVTGANVGLGFASAKQLAAKGATTILGCRSLTKCENAKMEIRDLVPGAKVEAAILDLSSLDSVAAFAKDFSARHTRLDILMLNAGFYGGYTLSSDGIELMFAVCHVGHFYLTKLLLPVLTTSAPSTVTVVSSNKHFESYPEGVRLSISGLNNATAFVEDQAYGQAKLANLLFAQELAERTSGQDVFVNAVHPGGVDTELLRIIEAKLVPIVGGEWANSVYRAFRQVINLVLWDADTAALTQLYTATSPEILAGKISGRYFVPVAREGETAAIAKNVNLQKMLWEFTEELIVPWTVDVQ